MFEDLTLDFLNTNTTFCTKCMTPSDFSKVLYAQSKSQ